MDISPLAVILAPEDNTSAERPQSRSSGPDVGQKGCRQPTMMLVHGCGSGYGGGGRCAGIESWKSSLLSAVGAFDAPPE